MNEHTATTVVYCRTYSDWLKYVSPLQTGGGHIQDSVHTWATELWGVVKVAVQWLEEGAEKNEVHNSVYIAGSFILERIRGVKHKSNADSLLLEELQSITDSAVRWTFTVPEVSALDDLTEVLDRLSNLLSRYKYGESVPWVSVTTIMDSREAAHTLKTRLVTQDTHLSSRQGAEMKEEWLVIFTTKGDNVDALLRTIFDLPSTRGIELSWGVGEEG